MNLTDLDVVGEETFDPKALHNNFGQNGEYLEEEESDDSGEDDDGFIDKDEGDYYDFDEFNDELESDLYKEEATPTFREVYRRSSKPLTSKAQSYTRTEAQPHTGTEAQSRQAGLYPSLQWVLDKGNKLITDWEPEEVAASRETVQESQNYSSMVAHMILPLDRSEYKFTEVSSLSHKAPASNTQEGHYNKTSMLDHKVAEVDNWEEEVHVSQ